MYRKSQWEVFRGKKPVDILAFAAVRAEKSIAILYCGTACFVRQFPPSVFRIKESRKKDRKSITDRKDATIVTLAILVTTNVK